MLRVGLMRWAARVVGNLERIAIHPSIRSDPVSFRRARTYFWCCLVPGSTLLMMILVDGIEGGDVRTMAVVGVGHALVCMSAITLRVFDSLRWPVGIVATLATVQLVSATWWTGGTESLVIAVYPVAVVFFALLGTVRGSVIGGTTLMLSLFGMYWLMEQGVSPAGPPLRKAIHLAVESWAALTGLAIALFYLRETSAHLARVDFELAQRTLAMAEVERQRDIRDRFLSYFSHELRNPLTTVSLSAEMLSAGLPPERRASALRSLLRASERLVEVANDVLDYSTLEAGRLKLNPSQTELASLVDSLLEEVGPQTTDVLAVDVLIDKGVTVYADPLRVRQLMSNLITNALRYSNATRLTISATQRETHVLIRVADNGVGIATEHRAQLFDAFSRGGQTDGLGTGLGLPISRDLARAMGGDVRFDDNDHGGATFDVILRAHPESSAEEAGSIEVASQ